MPGREAKKRSWGAYSWLGATVVATAVAVYSWKYSQTVSRVKLHVGTGGKFSKVLASCVSLQRRYWPAPLAASAHVQTIVTVLRQATLVGAYNRQIVGLQDGGCVALDWWKGSCSRLQHGSTETPIVLILHGLTGGSQEGYIKWMCRAVAASGWRAVVLNYRGCAGLPLTSPKCYDAVSTGDVRAAVVHIRRDHPTAPLFAVGYSLGAILLTKYTADADSRVFAPLSSPSGACLQPPAAVCKHLHRAPGSPSHDQRARARERERTPPASVASCATPAPHTHADKQQSQSQSQSSGDSPDGLHTPRVVGPDAFSAANWWQRGSGSPAASARSSCQSHPMHGWDWQACSASWPEPLRRATTGTAVDSSLPGDSSLAMHPSDQNTSPLPLRGISRNGDSTGAGKHVQFGDVGEKDRGGGAGSSPGAVSGSGLTAAVAISSPFELLSASDRLQTPWTMSWVYNIILTARLKMYVRKHSHKISLARNVQLRHIYASTTLREFDAAGTCKFHGFQTVDEYYLQCSSHGHIPRIRTPFLFVASEDDPFQGDVRTAVQQAVANPSTAIALTRAGGHCAHLMGIMPLAHSWTDGVTMDVFHAVHAHTTGQAPPPPAANPPRNGWLAGGSA